MNKTLWIWQFAELPAQRLPDIVASQGFNRVCVKALDGEDWQGAYDRAADSIKDLDACKRWLRDFNARGIACDFWAVPLLEDAAGTQAQMEAYSAIMQELPGRLVLDFEPYKGFYDDYPLAPFMEQLHNANLTNNGKLAACFDPRRMDWIAEHLASFDWWLPMVYDVEWMPHLYEFDNFGAPWEPILSVSDTLESWGAIVRDPVLGNENGCTGFGVWRAPLLSDEQIDFVKGR